MFNRCAQFKPFKSFEIDGSDPEPGFHFLTLLPMNLLALRAVKRPPVTAVP
jgi:hypothetical protein